MDIFPKINLIIATPSWVSVRNFFLRGVGRNQKEAGPEKAKRRKTSPVVSLQALCAFMFRCTGARSLELFAFPYVVRPVVVGSRKINSFSPSASTAADSKTTFSALRNSVALQLGRLQDPGQAVALEGEEAQQNRGKGRRLRKLGTTLQPFRFFTALRVEDTRVS